MVTDKASTETGKHRADKRRQTLDGDFDRIIRVTNEQLHQHTVADHEGVQEGSGRVIVKILPSYQIQQTAEMSKMKNTYNEAK